MTTGVYNTIKLVKRLDVTIERLANAAILPGMLIELMSTNKVRKHATAGATIGPKLFALEAELAGDGIDDAYEENDRVFCWQAVPGEEVFGILKDGESVVIGDVLESAGGGLLRKHVPESESWGSDEPGSVVVKYPLIGVALETKDLSDSSGAEESSGPVGYNKRIRVLVI